MPDLLVPEVLENIRPTAPGFESRLEVRVLRMVVLDAMLRAGA
jgi:hypothetical protein